MKTKDEVIQVMNEMINCLTDDFENYASSDIANWISKLVEIQLKMLHNTRPYKEFVEDMEKQQILKEQFVESEEAIKSKEAVINEEVDEVEEEDDYEELEKEEEELQNKIKDIQI